MKNVLGRGSDPVPRPTMESTSTLADASKLWGVHPETLRLRVVGGRLPFFRKDAAGRWVASTQDVQGAKVLEVGRVSKPPFDVASDALREAIDDGRVVPVDGCLSYADIELITKNDDRKTSRHGRARRAVAAAPGDEAMAGLESSARSPCLRSVAPTVDTSKRRDRNAIIQRYLRERWSPCDLPDWFFDTRSCPPFVAPANIFRYEYGEHAFEDHEEVGFPVVNGMERPEQGVGAFTFIRRSSGFVVLKAGDGPVFTPEDPCFADEEGVHPTGATPSRFEAANQEWERARLEWVLEYQRRGPTTRRCDLCTDWSGRRPPLPERRDRRAALHSYADQRKSPCDLPDWFWGEALPPYEPPVDTFYATFGRRWVHPSTGETWTTIRLSARWVTRVEDYPTAHYEGPMEYPGVPGAYPEGTEVPEFAEQNWAYKQGWYEWYEEWARRRRAPVETPSPDHPPSSMPRIESITERVEDRVLAEATCDGETDVEDLDDFGVEPDEEVA